MVEAELEVLAGDSAEQRAAEGVMIAGLAARLGIALGPHRFTTPDGARTEVDGVSLSPPVLVEAWAHQGSPKSAQKAKVMTDALKLLWVEATHLPGAQKILLLSDEKAAAHFRGSSWMATALQHFRFEITVVELPPEQRAAVKAAQDRQKR